MARGHLGCTISKLPGQVCVAQATSRGLRARIIPQKSFLDPESVVFVVYFELVDKILKT